MNTVLAHRCLPPRLLALHRAGTAITSRTMASPAKLVSAARAVTSDSPRPVLLLDIMDTLVFDPFFTKMGPFFGMTFKELLAAKHPTTWLDFECGHITEEQAYQRFFADGRACNGPGLRQMMSDTYEYLDGVEALLVRLHGAGYEVHSMSNYPVWYKIIEDKLRVSRYLQWTFVSCDGPMKGLRKPALEAYACAIATLQRPAGELIFVDDRQVNVDAAVAAGMEGLLFRGAEGLEVQLLKLGLQF